MNLLRGNIFPRTLAAGRVFGFFAILHVAVFSLIVCAFILTSDRVAQKPLDALFDASFEEAIVQFVVAGNGRVLICRDREACAYLAKRFWSSSGITERQEMLFDGNPSLYYSRIDVWMSDSGKASMSGLVGKRGLLLSVDTHTLADGVDTDCVEIDQNAPVALVEAFDWLGSADQNSTPPFRRPVAVRWLENGRSKIEFVAPQIGLSARFPDNYLRGKN